MDSTPMENNNVVEHSSSSSIRNSLVEQRSIQILNLTCDSSTEEFVIRTSADHDNLISSDSNEFIIVTDKDENSKQPLSSTETESESCSNKKQVDYNQLDTNTSTTSDPEKEIAYNKELNDSVTIDDLTQDFYETTDQYKKCNKKIDGGERSISTAATLSCSNSLLTASAASLSASTQSINSSPGAFSINGPNRNNNNTNNSSNNNAAIDVIQQLLMVDDITENDDDELESTTKTTIKANAMNEEDYEKEVRNRILQNAVIAEEVVEDLEQQQEQEQQQGEEASEEIMTQQQCKMLSFCKSHCSTSRLIVLIIFVILVLGKSTTIN